MQLASELMPQVVEKKSGLIVVKRKSDLYYYSEKLGALASLERIDLPLKVKIGDALVERIVHQEAAKCDFWALGRIGSRHLFYGSAGQVVPRNVCARWIEKLLAKRAAEEFHKLSLFLLGQLARKTDQRELNIEDELVGKIVKMYGDDELKKWLLEVHSPSIAEQEEIFGDRLPAGLILEEGKL